MGSEFERGAAEARKMIRVHGAVATRAQFDSCSWDGDEYDRGFESVLLDHETATILTQLEQLASSEPENKQAAYYAHALQESNTEIREVNPLRQALEMYEEAFDLMFAQCCSNGIFDA